ncbi:MAG: ergothioneine biosynthesis protein EgtB [Rudaea sp.]|nr:ergothioneine biosynthesis protein EgtB [Rudaea sp.]
MRLPTAQSSSAGDTASYPFDGPTERLAEKYRRVREQTVALCAGLSAEDAVVQSMPSASPAKWHLAHTTWFFDEFVLHPARGQHIASDSWRYLFNSYYQSIGPMQARPQRGLLSRPPLGQVLEYRRRVDEEVGKAISTMAGDKALADAVTLGLNHEQQHQELILTDIKHLFWRNPLQPAYRDRAPAAGGRNSMPLRFLRGEEGMGRIGHAGSGFAFDNELPQHAVVLHPHALANRLVTNAEFREFIEAGGYRTPTLWLAEGWDTVQREAWDRPLYWSTDMHSAFTLDGVQELDAHAPVCHVSFFEADAFARWAQARLPTEAEWERRAMTSRSDGNFLESDVLQPRAAEADTGANPLQMFGDAWEWTSSPYTGYPGYKALPGALGEYNGKFMNGQWVLRGGSCVTPRDHIRATYRNFFAPAERWQFAGVRLARDA